MPHNLLQAISLPDTNTWLSVTYTYDDDEGDPVTHMLNVVGENAERGPFLLKRFTEFLKEDLGFTIQENVTVSVPPTIFPMETKGRFTETTIKVGPPTSAVLPQARSKRRPQGRYCLAAAASLVVLVGATWEFMTPSLAHIMYNYLDGHSPRAITEQESQRVVHMNGKWYRMNIKRREGDPWVLVRVKSMKEITSDTVGSNVLLAEKINSAEIKIHPDTP